MMKLFKLYFVFCFLSHCTKLNAQSLLADSAKVAGTLKELLNICARANFADPKVKELGIFYKAAPYIVYRGENQVRKWKDFADYSRSEDKKGVDEICTKINGSVNQDTTYTFVRYHTETESEGRWYVIIVSYTRKGVDKQAAFAFLKIKERFALGDID